MSFNTFGTPYSNAALGATAVAVPVPARVADKGGLGSVVQKVKNARIGNQHASQLVYAARNRVATSSDFDIVVPGSSNRLLKINNNTDYVSVIASGASTPVVIEFGSDPTETVG